MSNSNSDSRAEMLFKHSNCQVLEFGQEIKVSINDDTPDSVLVLLNQVATLLSQEDYYFAMDLCYIEIQNLKESLGVNYLHPVSLVYTIFASIQHQMRHYKDAAKLLCGTLSLQELIYGRNNPLTVTTLSNLAVVLVEQGKYKEIEKLAERALDICDQSAYHECLYIAKILNTLALYFDKHGKYVELERCYNRALKIYETNLDPTDPEVADTSNKLALVYLNLGKHKDAEVIFKRVVSRAYEKEFGFADNKSKWMQWLTSKKVFGFIKDSNKPANNIWEIAEGRERRKGTRKGVEAPSPWYKSANLDSPAFNVALNGLQVLYENQGKNIAAATLRDFANQPLIYTAETVTDAKGQDLINLSTPSTSSISKLPPTLPSILKGGTLPPLRPTRTAPSQQAPLLEHLVAELQAEIAEKSRQLAEAQRTIQTHGAFCSICMTEVANRMWSRCNHLAACGECAESYSDSVTEENRSRDGIACPKCRTHGYPLPVFI